MSAIHLVILPTTGDGKTLATAFAPDFGGAKVGRWGQASAAWRKDGRQAVWVETDDLATILSVKGAELIDKVSDDVTIAQSALVSAYRSKIQAAEAAKMAEIG